MPAIRTKLLVAATPFEADFFLSAAGHRRPRAWVERDRCLVWRVDESSDLAVGVTGVGTEAAAAGLNSLLDIFENCSCVIGIGFAGGLIKTARNGDLVLPTEVQRREGNIVPTEWLRMGLASHAETVERRSLITVDRVVTTPGEKAALFAATGAETVDMESAVWGVIARERKLPWAIVRSILDGGGDALPSDRFLKAFDLYGRVRWKKALSRFLRHPGDLRRALHIYRHLAPRAASRYADLLVKWLREEPKDRSQPGENPAVVGERP